MHQTTRSKKLISMFGRLNLCINYDKVLDVKKDVTNAILEKCSENNGVFILTCLIENSRPFFAIDNTDININTPTGKHQLHVTAMAVFQQKLKPTTKTVMRIQRRSKRHRSNVSLYEDINVCEKLPRKVLQQRVVNFVEISEDTSQHYRTYDLVWFLLKTSCVNMASKVSRDAW